MFLEKFYQQTNAHNILFNKNINIQNATYNMISNVLTFKNVYLLYAYIEKNCWRKCSNNSIP